MLGLPKGIEEFLWVFIADLAAAGVMFLGFKLFEKYAKKKGF